MKLCYEASNTHQEGEGSVADITRALKATLLYASVSRQQAGADV